VTVVSGKHGLATVKGFGVVCSDKEEETAHVSHVGRRNDEGDDSGSSVLIGDISDGD